jgi:hypothetical protein
MKKLILAGAFALFVTPAFAVPMCDVGPKNADGMVDYGFGNVTEDESAQLAEQELHAAGINAHQTRFWNGCIQTFVTVDGREEMQFYDTTTLRRIPVN